MTIAARPVGGNHHRLIRILKKIPLFAGLYDEEYETLLSVCRVAQYRAGETIFHEGDEGRDMYVVLAGEVEIATRWGGVLHVMRPGEILGEVAVVSDMQRTADASARADLFLLRLTRADLDAFLLRQPRVAYLLMKNIARALAERLVVSNHRAVGILELSGDTHLDPGPPDLE